MKYLKGKLSKKGGWEEERKRGREREREKEREREREREGRDKEREGENESTREREGENEIERERERGRGRDRGRWIDRYRVFHGFGQAKFAYGGSILGLSQLSLLSEMPLKMRLNLKGVRIDLKIIFSLL